MLEPRTISEAAGFIRRGELTPSELLEQCLSRVDRYEAKVRTWAFLDRERIRREAEELTAELKRGQNRGPLHGIPIGIKDIIDVFDMPTGCGSKLWANSHARQDATCVQRLRQAGAIVMGKTVTTTFAYMDPPVTRNPWNLERTPGGSSSGSAAAVACGMCLGALGTQTGGSVTRPASFCGVCSLKPTHGRINIDGVLPFAPSLDHIGVMANSVRDLALLVQPLTGADNNAPLPYHYHAELQREGYARNRQLATLPEFLSGAVDPEMIAALTALREKTTAADWEWNDLPLPPSFGEVRSNHYIVMSVEAATYHGDRLRRRPEDYPPRIRKLIEDGMATPAPVFARIRDHLSAFRDEMERAFVGNWRTFITPATLGPAPTPETTGDPVCNSPWSYAGLPTVSLPIHWTTSGLPLAAQLVGDSWCEDDLLAVARMLEETIGFERRPLPL